MDYKKEYEAMVQRARELHEAGNDLTKRQMEIVCPELAESEDERIRKELITYHKKMAEANEETCNPNNLHTKWVAYLENLQKEQKPAEWSEEDETRLKVIGEELERYIMFSEYRTPLSVDDIDWLKNLPERFSPQPMQEWSEEDRDKVTQYLHNMDGGMFWSKATEITREILDILRPQPHWKPSPLQLKALELAANDNFLSCEELDMLNRLYEQLKKL